MRRIFLNIDMLPHHLLIVLVTFVNVAVTVTALDIPNCSISSAALTAQNNTCIDLSLCPNPGAMQICPMIYFPVCGKNMSNLLSNDVDTMSNILPLINIGCDEVTYCNFCDAHINGIGRYTEGVCGHIDSQIESNPINPKLSTRPSAKPSAKSTLKPSAKPSTKPSTKPSRRPRVKPSLKPSLKPK